MNRVEKLMVRKMRRKAGDQAGLTREKMKWQAEEQSRLGFIKKEPNTGLLRKERDTRLPLGVAEWEWGYVSSIGGQSVIRGKRFGGIFKGNTIGLVYTNEARIHLAI